MILNYRPTPAEIWYAAIENEQADQPRIIPVMPIKEK